MNFNQQKQNYLDKMKSLCNGGKDKSKVGGIDKEIKPLIDKINANEYFYTTSSCAGRIIITTMPKNGRNYEWLLISHDPVNFPEINAVVSGLNVEDEVWFKMDGFIIHLCCADLESANLLLKRLKAIGLKRSGIISLKDRIIIEIIGNERVECPIYDQKLLVDEDFLRVLIEKANDRLIKNREWIDKLVDVF
ncbi:tRNA wybutosine-synthesizing 3 family protein [Nanoarchaeota archaeon]